MNKEINKILIAGTEYDIRDSRFDEAWEAETARQEAEQGRATAEQQRVDAEAERAEEFAGFEGKIAAKEDAANKVTSIGADANNNTFPTTRAVLNSIAEVKNIEVTPEMLSESTKQYINASGGGTITNLADDEDLTSVGNVLKLADKDYSPTSYSGMGRVYLRKNMVDGKNILTQEMMTKENTIYIIQYNYDLNGATINVPSGCTLDFQGGSLGNGTIKMQDTYIQGKAKILTEIASGSTCLNEHLNILWFGAVSGDKTIDTGAIITKLGNVNVNTIIIPEGTFYSKSFKLPAYKYLKGNGNSKSILKAIDNGLSYSYSGVQIDEIFIAIYQPGNRITDITIDGSYDEEKRNVCVGLYQAGFSFKLERCKMINAIGCVWMRCIGGYISFTDNLFYTGVDFCLKLENHIDHTQILRNNFEGFETIGENGVIIVDQESVSGGICKSLLIAENRFERVKAKIIYNFKHCGYYLNVQHNIYLLPTLEESSIIYKLDKQSSVARFRDEYPQSFGASIHRYIIGNNASVTSVIIDNAVEALRAEYVGYCDENGDFKTWYTSGDFSRINIKLRKKDLWLPITTALNQSTELTSNTLIGKLHIKPHYNYVVLRGYNSNNWLTLQSERLFVRSNESEDGTTQRDISWLLNSIGSTTNNRPTSNLIAGVFYFDTTLNKPIWWTGSAWVDATGQEV